MIKGQHGYEYRSRTCTPGNTNGSFPAYFIDPVGNHNLLNPYYNSQTQELLIVN